MLAYVVRRLLLIIPTLFGIMVINFVVIQFAPGGPIEQAISELTDPDLSVTGRITGAGGGEVQSETVGSMGSGGSSRYRGAEGLDEEFIAKLEKQFGFDKPLWERFFLMIGNYLKFDFGTSYFRDQTVVNLVFEKMPVSISLGLCTTIIVYLFSIPMGVGKAVWDGSPFDVWTSAVVIIGNAIPAFMFAVMLIVIFAGGSYFEWFPLQGLTSENYKELSFIGKFLDRVHHLVLPVFAMVIGGFAALTFLTKNSFVDQINQQYVMTARAKGLKEGRVLFGHVFRNSMLIVIAGFPGAFVGILFTGSLLIEIIFGLDGLGRLGYEAVLKRDYPVMFATLYFFTLLGLVMNLIGDLTYTFVDPRIDFESRAT
ncbi:MAG: microcin C ABC transporter permease YejB [Gammaproteobacteria bacterium]|nr:microcin C ABC transporter permease YejB [Gammaproteobacteria bacterium]